MGKSKKRKRSQSKPPPPHPRSHGSINSTTPRIAQLLNIDFSSKTLFLGEGDFTFSSSLLPHLPAPPPHTYLPTAYDSSHSTLSKYNDTAQKSLSALSSHTTPAFNVDATNIRATLPPSHNTTLFTHVIFMFPHTGEQRVHLNRELLVNFFSSVRDVVSFDPKHEPKIFVALTDSRPYSDWRLVEAAAASGFKIVSEERWRSHDGLRGYRHVTTKAAGAYGGVGGTMETGGERGAIVYTFGVDGAYKAGGGGRGDEEIVEVNNGVEIFLGNDSSDEDEQTPPPWKEETRKRAIDMLDIVETTKHKKKRKKKRKM